MLVIVWGDDRTSKVVTVCHCSVRAGGVILLLIKCTSNSCIGGGTIETQGAHAPQVLFLWGEGAVPPGHIYFKGI